LNRRLFLKAASGAVVLIVPSGCRPLVVPPTPGPVPPQPGTPFAWDDTLYKIVQDLVEKAWSLYLAGEFGETDAHWDFIGRGRRHGWTGARAEYGVGGDSACKDASGKVWPRDRDNWCHPPVTATWAADNAVRNLLDRGLPPNEGHVRDFRGPWTHAAIGHHEGMFAIEYGTPS
jgi:hypothetical protein